jgi:hypothetical protein
MGIGGGFHRREDWSMAKRPATQMSACLLERVSTLDMLLSYCRYDLGCGVRRLPFGCGNST